MITYKNIELNFYSFEILHLEHKKTKIDYNEAEPEREGSNY